MIAKNKNIPLKHQNKGNINWKLIAFQLYPTLKLKIKKNVIYNKRRYIKKS